MVVMALVTTFITTPVVSFLYPEWYQKETNAQAFETSGSSNRIDNMTVNEKDSIKLSTVEAVGLERYCIVTMLNRIESVPSMMALIQLLKRDKVFTSVEMHALRLLELTQRTSAVMKVKDLRESQRQDPVLNVLRTFANLIGIKTLQTHFDFCPTTDFIKTVSDYGKDVHADLILLPWINRYLIQNENYSSVLLDNTSTDIDFVTAAFSIHHCNVGLFVDRGFGQIQDGDFDVTPHVIVVYEGSPDDRAALLFALKLQAYKKINLTVVTTQLKYEGNSSVLYASNSGIQQYIQDETMYSLESLFSFNNETSNISCRRVDSLTGLSISKALTQPLNKHDLVILGRNAGVLSESTSSPLLNPFDNKEYEAALGSFGFHILKNGNRHTSVLIIQSNMQPST